MTWALVFVSILAAIISQYWTKLFGYGSPFIAELFVGPTLWSLAFFTAIYSTHREKRRVRLWFFAPTGVVAFWQLGLTTYILIIWRIRGFV
jgi:hypothetical protein